MSAKPIRVIPSRKQINLNGAIDRCAQIRERNELHGHKIPINQGDDVIDHKGRIGVLVHKEFLRECPEVGHDIWQLTVQYGASLVNYSNPATLRRKGVRKGFKVKIRSNAFES